MMSHRVAPAEGSVSRPVLDVGVADGGEQSLVLCSRGTEAEKQRQLEVAAAAIG